MRWFALATLVAASGCQVVFGLSQVKPLPDAPPDAPAACPADYTTTNGGTSLYRLVATPLPFADAAKDCADDETPGLTGHTHLAVLSDVNELMFLYTLGGNRWVGLSDLATQGTWRWVTAEAAMDASAGDVQLWAPTEPNNLMTEKCVHFDSQHPNLVNNVICTETHTYACECDAFANDPSTYP